MRRTGSPERNRKTRKRYHLEKLDAQILDRYEKLAELSERRNKMLEKIVIESDDLKEAYPETFPANGIGGSLQAEGVKGVLFSLIDELPNMGIPISKPMLKNLKAVVDSKPELVREIERRLNATLEEKVTGQVAKKAQITQ